MGLVFQSQISALDWLSELGKGKWQHFPRDHGSRKKKGEDADRSQVAGCKAGEAWGSPVSMSHYS